MKPPFSVLVVNGDGSRVLRFRLPRWVVWLAQRHQVKLGLLSANAQGLPVLTDTTLPLMVAAADRLNLTRVGFGWQFRAPRLQKRPPLARRLDMEGAPPEADGGVVGVPTTTLPCMNECTLQ